MIAKYSFIDLYPYILLLCFFLYVTFAKNVDKKHKANFIFVTILLFVIFRYQVGWDYDSYLEIIQSGEKAIEESRFEPLSKFIFTISNVLNFYPLTFITFGCLHLFLLRKVINRLCVDKPIAWIFYFLIPLFFLQDLSTIRQAVSTQFVFVSYLYLRDRKYTKYVLLVLLGTLFHRSAAIGLLLFVLNLKTIPNYVNWIIFIASFFAQAFAMTLVQRFITDDALLFYFNAMEASSTSLLNYYYYAINLFFLINYKNFANVNEEYAKYIQISNLGIFIFNALLFEPVTSTRLSLYFLYFWIPLFSAVHTISKTYRNRFVNLLPFIFVFLFFLILYINGYNNNILEKVSFIPYRFWFNNL